jgi:succinyl-diaminopimelate desuccinylase
MAGLLDPVVHTQALIRCESVTPKEAGTLEYLQRILAVVGFDCHRMTFQSDGMPEVDNLYARIGTGAPHLCFAGHVDVVPPGDEAAWTYPPFAAEIVDDLLYGRGAVDMKGGIAAMLAATLRYLVECGGTPKGSISFLITTDEEGPAVDGTAKVVEWMLERDERPNHCILGEPTHPDTLGDTIKIGRRGSLNGKLTILGEQGHVAYPHLANNPLTGLVAVLKRYLDEPLDEGTSNFAPSNIEITTIDTDNPTTNLIPAKASARFNIRFNDLHTSASLSNQITALTETMLRDTGLHYDLHLEPSAEAFLSQPGAWVETLAKAADDVTGLTPKLSTSGGTSDARFIYKLCPVVEFGLVNRTIHKVNEHVPLSHLQDLTTIFQNFLRRYFGNKGL